MFKQFLCAILVILVTPLTVSAADYEIITYNFNADVSESRTAYINESYNIYFMKQIDSIERRLSNRLTIIRPDSSTILNYIKINKLDVLSGNFDYKDNVITLYNDADKETVNSFEIEYKYNMGKDLSSKYDELYFNIVDGTIDANISNVNFEIKMPSNIDENQIRFLIDDTYDISDDDVEYTVEDNVIKGSLSMFLNPNQKFSIRVELKNNYFVNETDNYNYMMFIIILLPLISLLLAVYSWFKYARGNKYKSKIVSNPPYGYDPAETGFLYNGFSKDHDIVSVLIKLANDGYLMFEEADDGYKLERPNSFKIIKLKKYRGSNAIQKLLFEKLFSKSESIEIKDIEYNLYDTLFKSKETLDNKENRSDLFFSNIKIIKKILISLIFISCVVINIHSSELIFNTYLLAPLVAASLMLGIYIVFIMDSQLISKIIIGGVLIGITLFLAVTPIMNDLMTTIIYVISIILVLVSSTIFKSLPIRTKYGNSLLGEVYGFKLGLENMTKEELKSNLEENPNYFYEMYPYAYVFNITEVWNYKGNDFIKEFPVWYKTKEDFSLQNFQKFCRNMIFITTQAMYKRQTPGMSGTHVEYKKASRVQALEER